MLNRSYPCSHFTFIFSSNYKFWSRNDGGDGPDHFWMKFLVIDLMNHFCVIIRNCSRDKAKKRVILTIADIGLPYFWFSRNASRSFQKLVYFGFKMRHWLHIATDIHIYHSKMVGKQRRMRPRLPQWLEDLWNVSVVVSLCHFHTPPNGEWLTWPVIHFQYICC